MEYKCMKITEIKNRRNTENANKGNLQTRVKTSSEHDENRLLNAKQIQPKT